eukprot:scaffold129027_cov54-Phaeocystis_antarctica.AAC.2
MANRVAGSSSARDSAARCSSARGWAAGGCSSGLRPPKRRPDRSGGPMDVGEQRCDVSDERASGMERSQRWRSRHRHEQVNSQVPGARGGRADEATRHRGHRENQRAPHDGGARASFSGWRRSARTPFETASHFAADR